MALKEFALLLLVAFAAQQIQGAENTIAPVIPDSTTEHPPETTTESTTTPATTSTTTESSSTTEPTTSTSTTTEAPTTTTAAPPPPPTPKPGPLPAPDLGKWHFRNATTNQTCIIVQMAVQLNVSYVVAADNSTRMVLFNLPANDTSVASGLCDGEQNVLQLVWKKFNTVKLTFSVNSTVKEYQLIELRLDLNASDISADAKANQTIKLTHQRKEFVTPLTMSYHCTRAQTLNLTAADSSEVTVLGQALVSRLQLEAFHTRDSDVFSTAKDCDAIDTPDIVPIAVGCALAGLVVIVLIAYLVGRRRAQARGYLSM